MPSGSFFSFLFNVSGGILNIKNTTLSDQTFHTVVQASQGNITFVDSVVSGCLFYSDGFYFSGTGFLIVIQNITFFKNILVTSFLTFVEFTNSMITLNSLEFILNQPIFYIFYTRYIAIMNGENNTIVFQNYLIFNLSFTGIFLLFFFIMWG